MMKILIIGLGSIARKHITALDLLNIEAHYYALRNSRSSNSEESNITDIFDFAEIPDDIDFIIISNPTSKHAETVSQCLVLEKPLFIEKPVFDSMDFPEEILSTIKDKDIITYVAFNMRYHPAIAFLREEIMNNRPIEYNSYCGSYLPDWRPGQDYRTSYSSNPELGGGVHLDIIHEIDFCRYILGDPISSQMYKSKKSKLDIDSSDIAHYILDFSNTSAFITLNYYRCDLRRDIECVWADKTWFIDLVENKILDQDNNVIYSEGYDIMDTYVSQMKNYIDCLNTGRIIENDIFEGIKTLRLALNE